MRRSALRVATLEEICHYGKTLPKGLRPPMTGGAGYALVGTAGAATTVSTSVTPVWDASETRTANNLLVCWGVNTSNAAAPTTSTAGWLTAVSQAATTSAGGVALFYKIAAGSDAAPTVTSSAGNVSASVAEFSGNASASPLDQIKGATAGTSPATATAPGVDAAPGELLLYASGASKSGGGNTNTLTNALNNAIAVDVRNVGAVSLTSHWAWGYGITTSNASADSDAFSVATTTSINSMTVAIASFKLPAAVAALVSAQLRGRHPAVRNPSPAPGRF